MSRKNKSTLNPDAHFESLGELLTQLRTHLTASTEKKGTYGDYLRLLEFYRENSDQQVKEIIVSWVDNENIETPPRP
jgi:hypothetical protein